MPPTRPARRVVLTTHDPAIAARLEQRWSMVDGVLESHLEVPPHDAELARGLVARRRARLVAAAAGVAVAVALIASIGAFLAGVDRGDDRPRARARARSTGRFRPKRARRSPQAPAQRCAPFPGVRTAEPVLYARTTGYHASAGGATSTARPDSCSVCRTATGRRSPASCASSSARAPGVLLAQQMAANLGVGVGDRVSIGRAGMPDAQVRIDGIVDFTAPQQLLLPPAAATARHAGAGARQRPDRAGGSLAGALRGARAHAPRARPETRCTRTSRAAPCPATPRPRTHARSASPGTSRRARRGRRVVGNNLAHRTRCRARRQPVRAASPFLFLGLPGALLAALLTGAIAAGGRRSAPPRPGAPARPRCHVAPVLTRLALAESLLVGIAGGAVGLGAARGDRRHRVRLVELRCGCDRERCLGRGSVLAGVAIAALAIALPAWRDARGLTVAHARTAVRRTGGPWWAGYGLDLLAIAGAILVYRATSGGGGYQLVLVAEGITQVSVNYWSFLAPLLAWIGVGLLSYRLAELCLRRGRRLDRARLAARLGRARGHRRLEHVAAAQHDRAHAHAGRADDVLRRVDRGVQRHLPAAGRGRCAPLERRRRGARAPGGAVGLPRASAPASRRPPASPAIEPLQHRYAYVGRDLQDLYGVDAKTIVRGARLQDSWFAGGTASQPGRHARAHAERRPPERGGRARLPAAPGRSDHACACSTRAHAGRFRPLHLRRHHEGVPDRAQGRLHHRQRRLLAKATHDPAVVDAARPDRPAPRRRPSGSASAPRPGTRASVTDIETNRAADREQPDRASSSQGLTRVELGFALVLHRRGHRPAALARPRRPPPHVRDRPRARSAARASSADSCGRRPTFVTAGGVVLGGIAAAGITWMLVKLLTGVFDPPPSHAAVPWRYLADARRHRAGRRRRGGPLDAALARSPAARDAA